ncbi:MAG TPA: serine/threonine-protein kinase, partial [Nannocystis sp.]
MPRESWHTARLFSRRHAAELTVTHDGVTPRDDRGGAPNLTTPPAPDDPGSAAPNPEGPPLQTRLGRFMLLQLLGQGGMGVVYTAWDELLDRRVALKLLRTGHDGDAQARILHEAKGLARLSHPNVVQIYEVSASGGRLFIAMEYIAGNTLRAWTDEQRRAGADPRVLLDMYIQAGRGLAAAHAQGLVHRDFKPDNVLVGEDGRARVVDFGLVTIRHAAPDVHAPGGAPPAIDARLTADGAVHGTPAYMPPEQFAGLAADARSDQ